MAKQEMGTKATVTIETTPSGEIMVGLDLHGQKMGKSLTVVQGLALTGVDAIREKIRESFRVKEEKVVCGANENTPIR